MSDSKASTTRLRVRYSETDQMGTFYNSRALEWFECGRSEFMRALGTPYTEMESRGLMLPIVESHATYTGPAVYDDQLELTTTAHMVGKARVRFDVAIANLTTGVAIAAGWTVHAIVNCEGKPIRPPTWFTEAISGQ
jgi:acyl-CoA thioester hydrolase